MSISDSLIPGAVAKPNVSCAIIKKAAVSFWLCLLLLPVATAVASDAPVGKYVADAEVVGEGRLKVMLWNVFDATLYGPQGDYKSEQPFALSLTYLRKLKGRKIVKKTFEEIRVQGMRDKKLLAAWESQLTAIIPDVKAGQNITGIRDAGGSVWFYFNGKLAGSIEDPQFTQRFFDIWLGESTSEPDLRKKLLSL